MTTAEPRAFGALLKRYRHAAGLTQEGLAERAGLSARGISDLERGVSRSHRADTVQRLAMALALSARERGAFEHAALGDAHTAPSFPDVPVPVPPDPLPPLVGRGDELAVLDWHLSGQGPPVLLLAGEPGIGKSRLLYEAARRAAERGLQVVQGGCSRRGSQEPYAPLLGALEGYLRRRGPIHLRADLPGC